MNTQKKWPIIAGAGVLAVAVLAVMWWAVFGAFSNAEPGEHEPMHDAHPRPEQVSAEIAAQQVLSEGFTWTPGDDSSDLDGFINSDLVTERLREQLQSAADAQPAQALPSNWQAWANSGDVVRAVASAEDTDEQDESAEVVATVMQRVVHPDGETTPLSPFDVTATLVYDSTGETWLLDAYEVSSVG